MPQVCCLEIPAGTPLRNSANPMTRAAASDPHRTPRGAKAIIEGNCGTHCRCG
jgi:hypothetical protein